MTREAVQPLGIHHHSQAPAASTADLVNRRTKTKTFYRGTSRSGYVTTTVSQNSQYTFYRQFFCCTSSSEFPHWNFTTDITVHLSKAWAPILRCMYKWRFVCYQANTAGWLAGCRWCLGSIRSPPPNLHLASSEQWCWSGGRGILTELSLCYSLVLCSISAMHIAQS